MLDLVIVSAGLEKFVDQMVIDNKREITPFKQVNGENLSFPDHYSILLTFKDLPVDNKSLSLGKKFTRWNTNKRNGWENYFYFTDTNERFDEIVQYDANDPDFIMNAIEKYKRKSSSINIKRK